VDKLWITVGKSRFYVDIFIAKEERGMALRNTSLMALFYPQSKSSYEQSKRVSKGIDQHFSYFSTDFRSSYYDYLYKSSLRGGELIEKSLTSRRIRIKGRV
jgi:hypothetical protein